MKNSDLYEAAQRLIAAETTYLRMLEYRNGLPADPDYDLGVVVQLHWGASCVGGEEVRRAVQADLRLGMRARIDGAIEAARQRMFDAELALKKIARSDHA